MIGLGALTFTSPLLLSALLGLPVLWWLLKLIPPSPRQVTFPPIQFLLSLKDTQSSANHTPWWLMALRFLIVALTIIALSGPSWHRTPVHQGQGPLLLIVDNSWATGHNWPERQNALHGLIDEAARQDRLVLLVATAPQTNSQPAVSFMTAREARRAVDVLEPHPWPANLTATIELISRQLSALTEEPYDIVWISDSLQYPDTSSFADRLKSHGSVRYLQFSTDGGPLILSTPQVYPNKFSVEISRLSSGKTVAGKVRALDSKNQFLGQGDFSFEPNATVAHANISLPLELRNKTTSLQITNHKSASSTLLLDERWRRRSVGIATFAQDIEKPLLSDIYYSEKALQPFAEIQKATLRKLLISQPSVILLPGQEALSGEDIQDLKEWIEAGGTLVRFANARMAGDESALTPVPLRSGGRALEGALSWGTPQALGPFQSSSPFFGLNIPSDVTVSRQVLAEPSLELTSKTWAQLEDGTPLVTASQEGQGWLILFHITSSADWSTLPLSGLYVDMLRRILDISQSAGQAPTGTSAQFQSTLPPLLMLNGFGSITAPDLSHEPIDLAGQPWEPEPAHPPGLYGSAAQVKATNLSSEIKDIEPVLETPGGIQRIDTAAQPAIDLRAPFLLTALLLALLDGIVVLWISGALHMPSLKPALRSGVALLIAFTVFSPDNGFAQSEQPPEQQVLHAALETHLAYVKTGDASLDAISHAGLMGLTQTLRRRTAAEPGVPMAVNLETDELAFFPLIYWPVRANQKVLSPNASAKLNQYMANGGTLLLDTGDQNQKVLSTTTAHSQHLKKLLGQLNVPALVPVPRDHVLTKSFYLIQDYPGRWIGGPVWVETASAEGLNGTGQQNDGVSSIVIGSNDFAGAWAIDSNGRPRLPLVPGGPGQREGAMRFGVNLVMYTLTGNYKADQVHVPALLERLGQ